MMNRREIMEAVIYKRYQESLEMAARKVNNGWNESGIEDEVIAAERRLKADLEVLNRILANVEES